MKKDRRKLKICLAASAGGHLTQLLSVEKCWQGHEVVYISTLPVVEAKLKQRGKTYIVGECNRQHPVRSLVVLLKCIKIALKERPDVVLSTGAAPGLLFCFIAKVFGAKVVWLDSIANTERLSMSGRMVKPFANLILTQWPELSEKYKNVEYVGTVI
jgi:UDP-N-acetylglucosamine:LPS N-acetylglucosamine transferase